MKKTKAFFVVSEWNNDISWVEEYTDDYIIYDKSNTLPKNKKVLKIKNVGFNIFDIFHFIVNNYNSLPDVTAFLEGNPFDHCNIEKFNKIIYNEYFTPVEGYEHIKQEAYHRKGEDGGWMEINNNWYVPIIINEERPNNACKFFNSYNSFLQKFFENPIFPQWIRFAPGGQYIVPKKNILFYSKDFYEKLLHCVDYYKRPIECYIVERGLYTIFTNMYKEKK